MWRPQQKFTLKRPARQRMWPHESTIQRYVEQIGRDIVATYSFNVEAARSLSSNVWRYLSRTGTGARHATGGAPGEGAKNYPLAVTGNPAREGEAEASCCLANRSEERISSQAKREPPTPSSDCNILSRRMSGQECGKASCEYGSIVSKAK